MERLPHETDLLFRLIEGRRVVVCSGAGGVGKTTTAAAIGLAAARQGLRVVVLTIDPARRLADALGLSSLPADPVEVPRALQEAAGVPPHGALYALMLDPKATFDGLVRRLNEPEAAERILQNRLYRQISEMLAGMQEYTAEEKLHELAADPRFDLVVLDTPPTRNALDFLEAPDKLMRFLDEGVLRWFKPQPPKGPFGLLQRTGRLVGSVLGRIFGERFAEDLAEFLATLGGMTGTLRAHAEEVRGLLASDRSTFLLITAPEAASLDDALFFRGKLLELGLPFGGYVVNRLHRERPEPADDERRELATRLDRALSAADAASLLQRIEQAWSQHRSRATADRELLSTLEREGSAPLLGIPRLEGEIADLQGLARLIDGAFLPRGA